MEFRGDFGGNGRWTAKDGEEVLYDFYIGNEIQIYDYNHLKNILIIPLKLGVFEPLPGAYNKLSMAASEEGRSRLQWMKAHGFVEEDANRCQMAVTVHSIDTWRMGVTDQPSYFYMNLDESIEMCGPRHVDRAQAEDRVGMRIELALREGDLWYSLLQSSTGVKAVEVSNQIYEAGPGYDRLLALAEAALGYRPGDMDFLGKTTVRATLEWSIEGGASGKRVLEDKAALADLDVALAGADFSLGGYNCPSPAFLTLEFSDGDSASLAVAINAYNFFFYRGVYFETADNELLNRLFSLGDSYLDMMPH